MPGARIAVPRSVVAELQRLARRGTADARAALEYARGWPEVPAPGRGDAAVFAAARRERAVVVTADRALAARLLGQGLSVLQPRAASELVLRSGRPSGRLVGNG